MATTTSLLPVISKPAATSTQAVPFSSGGAPGTGPLPPAAAGAPSQNLASPYGAGSIWDNISSGLSNAPNIIRNAIPGGQQQSNPYPQVIGQTGALAGGIAGAQNSQLAQQQQALGNQLLGSGTGSNAGAGGGGGGGGNGAAAALANQIAGLQNSQHDIDINYLISQLHQLPQLTALNQNDYNSQLKNITSQQQLAKITHAQNVQQLLADAAQRGAYTAVGTGTAQQQLAATLAKQLQGLHSQTTGAADTFHSNILNLQKTFGDITGQIGKLRIAKQIEDAQARAAALGGAGGGSNPLAGLASFLRQQALSQQIAGLQGQQLNPGQIQTQLLGQYAQLSSVYGPEAAQQWLVGQFAAYGIQIPDFAPQFDPNSQHNVGGGTVVK